MVVIDEVHQLEDTISATFGIELGASRFASLARTVRSILDAPELVDQLEASGTSLARALVPHVGQRLKGRLEPEIADVLTAASDRLERIRGGLGRIDDSRGGDVEARRHRAVKATDSVTAEVHYALDPRPGSVTWVEGPDHVPLLRLAPIDVAADLQATLWSRATAVLTSAYDPHRRYRCGWVSSDPPRAVSDSGSSTSSTPAAPSTSRRSALLYCAAHLPDPRKPRPRGSPPRELHALITAAGGRTLALFTS